jgi:molybdenum cofactor cytidylyltransferase
MRSVAAIVLAAGSSTRLGQPKQLVAFEGETLVRRIVRAAAQAGCTPVVVVVGETGDEIATDLRGTDAQIVVNSDWQRGLGTSIKRGVEHIEQVEGIVVLACDQPFVDRAIIEALMNQQDVTGKRIVASRYANTLGIPALFSHSCFRELLQLSDASGAKALIEADTTRAAHIEFPAGAIDIDTPDDLARLRRRSSCERRPSSETR